MNSNYGKSARSQSSAFDFDLGLSSNRPRSLNDQKNPTSSYSSFSSTQPKPAWQPNKPSWTHQPVPTQAALPGLSTPPASMVGDILGKSWASSGSSGSTSGVGIVGKNPNLFGDLVSSALGQGKGNSNVPLKNATPATAASNKSPYSVGNLADSLPKSSENWGSFENFGNFTSAYNNSNNNNNKIPNLGGPSLRTMGGGGGGGSGVGSKRDPFGNLVDFGSKKSGSINSASKGHTVNNRGGDAFGDFQNASKPSTTTFPSSAPTANFNSFMGSNSGFDENFGIPIKNSALQNQPPVQTSGVDPLDVLFSSSSALAGDAAMAYGQFGGQQSSEVDDWGMDSEFGGGGHDMGGTTTELEGLPPPPTGVTAPSAKNKGMDYYKQGQYADAIKWLSWSVILLEKSGDNAATMEVLTSRASCYKEVGEYKKAVADCTKVLGHDDANVSVLVQRALLYESIEKYKLGAEDLRTVLKIDPSNMIARSTIHRLNKLAV